MRKLERIEIHKIKTIRLDNDLLADVRSGEPPEIIYRWSGPPTTGKKSQRKRSTRGQGRRERRG